MGKVATSKIGDVIRIPVAIKTGMNLDRFKRIDWYLGTDLELDKIPADECIVLWLKRE